MSWRDSIKSFFSGARRSLDEAEQLATSAIDDEMPEAGPGETVTTRREEVRPDGTRVVTTVTRTRVVVTKEWKS